MLIGRPRVIEEGAAVGVAADVGAGGSEAALGEEGVGGLEVGGGGAVAGALGAARAASCQPPGQRQGEGEAVLLLAVEALQLQAREGGGVLDLGRGALQLGGGFEQDDESGAAMPRIATLYVALAALFVAQMAGKVMTWDQQALMLIMLVLTTKGVAAVPKASLVVLAAALTSFGLPIEGIAVILGIDHFLDMGRTSINLLGNCVAAAAGRRVGKACWMTRKWPPSVLKMKCSNPI